MKRTETLSVKVGNITIGHQNKVVIQSMANIKTSNVNEVSKQINDLTSLGCELIRVSILDNEDALSLYEIKKRISIPLVADIHFDPNLAILAIQNGANKIRINPGNISLDSLNNIIKEAKNHHVAIRIGVNSGSLDQNTLDHYDQKVTSQGMIELLSKYLLPFEKQDFHDLVLSLKSSSPLLCIEAYRLASSLFPYPLHLGITEAGSKDIGMIRSSVGLSPLLLEGIGDTIRISLTSDPKDEIFTAKHLLQDVGLYFNMPTLISCPTCGRTKVDLEKLVNKIAPELEKIHYPLTVAIMGCVVNGPGEASHADIGLAGGQTRFVLFKKGKIIKTIKENEAYDILMEEIKKMTNQ